MSSEMRDQGPPEARAARRVVAIAASAGGLAALTEFLTKLPGDLPAAVVIVQHLDPTHQSRLATILARRTALFVKEAAEGDRLTEGTVYIAPPDQHLLVNPEGTLSLSHAGLVHFVRPSADLLFESVAAAYAENVIAVVLTGWGVDGATGASAVKHMGGTVIAQDPRSSEAFGMPSSAIGTGDVDLVLQMADIPSAVMTILSDTEAQ